MFDNVHKKLGFGCMRLPMKGGEVDYVELNKMVDLFMENGFNYFDTAHGYVETKSEIAVRECLVKRYPRDSYVLTDKLTNFYFKLEKDVRPFFESQLKACGVDYFDFYLMHAQSKEIFAHFKRCRAYEQALELKAEGKIKHFGISFHDTAEVLEQILTEYPQIDVVQIQLNFVDYDDPAIQSRKCLEVCNRHGKPVIVMEPVKVQGNELNTLYGLPILHRRLPEKDIDSRFIRVFEYEEYLQRLERELLLQRSTHKIGRKSVRVYRVRQMRKGLPSTLEDSRTFENGCKGV